MAAARVPAWRRTKEEISETQQDIEKVRAEAEKDTKAPAPPRKSK